ncbi:MAG: serine hydrolase [Desulfurococcales archaeon]|nr:serine hydrolase [Desulfurococcales archaeon]
MGDFSLLENFIIEKMRKTRIPGLSVAVVDRDEVVYARGFGLRDLSSGSRATPRTIYGIGSVTKSFTALAVLKLVEEGKLSLEDKVEDHIGVRLRPFGEPVKIHHLLTHSSGIPALAYAEAFIRGVLGLDSQWLPLSSPADIVAFMRESNEWAVAKPGHRFFYLNEGYVLLGSIVEKASGLKYEDYVRREILEPLGMKRTYFNKEEVGQDPDVATPYIVDREGRHHESRFPYGVTSDGGLLSNTLDLARYAGMFIGRGRLGETVVAEPETIESMEKGYIDTHFKLFGDEKYGYGLIVTNRFLGRKLVHHSGSVLVYTAFFGYLPSDGWAVIVLANSAGYPLSSIGMYALALALGYEPEKHLDFIRAERLLEKLEGIYQAYKGTHTYCIKRVGDFLSVIYKDKYTGSTTVLAPVELKEDYAKFYTRANGRVYEAEFFIKDDKVTMLYERYKMVKTSDIISPLHEC